MVVIGKKLLYSSKVVVYGQSGFIRAKLLCSVQMDVFGSKWLYSSKVIVFGQGGCIREKIVVFG